MSDPDTPEIVALRGAAAERQAAQRVRNRAALAKQHVTVADRLARRLVVWTPPRKNVSCNVTLVATEAEHLTFCISFCDATDNWREDYGGFSERFVRDEPMTKRLIRYLTAASAEPSDASLLRRLSNLEIVLPLTVCVEDNRPRLRIDVDHLWS